MGTSANLFKTDNKYLKPQGILQQFYLLHTTFSRKSLRPKIIKYIISPFLFGHEKKYPSSWVGDENVPAKYDVKSSPAF